MVAKLPNPPHRAGAGEGEDEGEMKKESYADSEKRGLPGQCVPANSRLYSQDWAEGVGRIRHLHHTIADVV